MEDLKKDMIDEKGVIPLSYLEQDMPETLVNFVIEELINKNDVVLEKLCRNNRYVELLATKMLDNVIGAWNGEKVNNLRKSLLDKFDMWRQKEVKWYRDIFLTHVGSIMTAEENRIG